MPFDPIKRIENSMALVALEILWSTPSRVSLSLSFVSKIQSTIGALLCLLLDTRLFMFMHLVPGIAVAYCRKYLSTNIAGRVRPLMHLAVIF